MNELRRIEAKTIRSFVLDNALLLGGNVLDYGAGRQPYRDVVEAAGGSYYALDQPDFPGSVVAVEVVPARPTLSPWDAILCTQVIQYVPDVLTLLSMFARLLSPSGYLVMTGPTCWPEVEKEDLHRFTTAGISRLVERAGFEVLRCDVRACVSAAEERFPIGWGLVASVSS